MDCYSMYSLVVKHGDGRLQVPAQMDISGLLMTVVLLYAGAEG